MGNKFCKLSNIRILQKKLSTQRNGKQFEVGNPGQWRLVLSASLIVIPRWQGSQKFSFAAKTIFSCLSTSIREHPQGAILETCDL